jgi:transcriptional regulator with XRE-family HTH domain
MLQRSRRILQQSQQKSERTVTDNARQSQIARLREVAASIGSQPKAAKAARVSVRSLRLYLAGEVPPSVKALGNLAAATGYSLDWILTGTGEKMRDAKCEPDPATRPLDAALVWGMRMTDLLAQLRGIREVYRSAGRDLERDEEDEVVGAAIDLIEGVPASERHPWIVDFVIGVHRSASQLVAKERCRRPVLPVRQDVAAANAPARKPRIA